MKSRKILFCAIALCFEFVASLPFSVDSQRYSGYYARPDVESYYQGNAQRHWNQRYDQGEYKAPGHQYQGREYPTINKDNYYSQNQQRYLPKTPPHLETQNVKYVNQQNTPREYVNRQTYEPRPVQEPENILQAPPQLANPEPFIPAIPAIPAFPLQNLPQPLIAREQEIPVIQPSPPRMERENAPSVDNFDRNFAKAANPVAQLPETRRPARPEIELYLSNPNIRKVLSTTKQKRRFLVIHPDGTVEHIDRLEKVAEKHPQYFLVKAGDVMANWNNDKSPTAVPLPLPKPLEISSQLVATPANGVLDAPIEKPVAADSVSLGEEPKPAIELPKEEPKPAEELPSVIKVEAVVQDPVITPDTMDKPQIQLSVTNIEKEVESVAKSDPVAAVAVAEVAPTNNEMTNIAPSSEPILATTAPPSEPVIAAIAPPSDPAVATIVPPSEPVIESNPPPSEPVVESNPPAPETVVANIVPEPKPPVAAIASVSDPIVAAAAPASEPIIAAVAQVSEPVATGEKEPEPVVATIALTPETVVANSTPELEPKTQVEANLPTSPVSDINVNSIPGPSNQVLPIVTNEDIFNLASKYTPPPDVEVPNFGDLDISKLPVKPALWFRTTDPNIWEKLSNKDTGVDIVYFFQIHNQPKIEKDIIKTIHPNGTVVQDVVESVWDFEGDTPRITKTSNVVNLGNL